MPDVKVGLVPFGLRSDGSNGILIDPTTKKPLASVLEVLASKPALNDAYNFVGRLVFSISDGNLYVFTDDPEDQWIGIENQPVVVGSADPVTAGDAGDLYYATDTQVLWLYDGDAWVGVGGMHGASVVWAFYVGDGVETLFSTNTTTYPPVDMVQVFVDGEAKYPGSDSVRDYYMVGNQVQLNFTPTGGQQIAIRTMTFVRAVRNSKFLTNLYVADGTVNEFDTGIVQASAGQVDVVVDGVVQSPYTGGAAGTYDYKIFTQDVSILSMTADGTLVTVITTSPHGLQVNDGVSIYGALQTEYNGYFTVLSVIDSTTFTYTSDEAPLSSATPNPSLYFGPVKRNDYVSFYNSSGALSPLHNGAKVYIRSIENVTAEAVQGEANTAANVGVGYGVYKDKTGSVLQFKSIRSGDRIDVSQTADEIIISSRSNAFARVTSHTGTPSTLIATVADEYVACRNVAGVAISIDLATNHAPSASLAGRVISVKDEVGNADTYNISIVPHAASSINGASAGSAYVIDAARGGVTLIFDGVNWHIKE